MTSRPLYVWSGTEWVMAAGIQGPTGPQGRVGATGPEWSLTYADAVVTTASLDPDATENGTVTLAQRWTLCKVATDRPARVRLYLSSADRSNDASREIGVNPDDGVGVFLDLVTYVELLEFPLSPVVDGFLESGSAVPYAITNLDVVSSTVEVTFSFFS